MLSFFLSTWKVKRISEMSWHQLSVLSTIFLETVFGSPRRVGLLQRCNSRFTTAAPWTAGSIWRHKNSGRGFPFRCSKKNLEMFKKNMNNVFTSNFLCLICGSFLTIFFWIVIICGSCESSNHLVSKAPTRWSASRWWGTRLAEARGDASASAIDATFQAWYGDKFQWEITSTFSDQIL